MGTEDYIITYEELSRVVETLREPIKEYANVYIQSWNNHGGRITIYGEDTLQHASECDKLVNENMPERYYLECSMVDEQYYLAEYNKYETPKQAITYILERKGD